MELITLLYPHHDTSKLAEVLGLSVGNLRSYAAHLRLRKDPSYSRNEPDAQLAQLLKARWAITRASDLENELGIPRQRLRTVANRLGLKKDRDWLIQRGLPVAPLDPELREIRRLRTAINCAINRRTKELTYARA